MNLLLLLDNLGSGGAQNQWTLLAKGLKEKGYKVTVATYYPQDFYKKVLSDNGIEHVLIEKKSRLGISFFLKLRKLVKEQKFDTVISILNTPNFYAALLKWSLGSKAKFIISHGSKTDFSKISWLQEKTRSWTNKVVDVVSCNSYHENENWVDHQPSIKHKMYTVYNGVNPEKFYPPVNERGIQRKLLAVGSISPMKNGMIVLKAIKQWKDLGKDKFKITWLGRVDENLAYRKEYAEQMFAFIDEHNLAEWISIEEPTSEILKCYHEHDALLLASTTEGLPNVVCEALTTGAPVIISNILDHPRMVEDGVEGFTFDPYSAESLVEALSKFFNLSDNEYQRMQAATVEKAIRLFSLDSFVGGFEKLIEA